MKEVGGLVHLHGFLHAHKPSCEDSKLLLTQLLLQVDVEVVAWSWTR
jgi:hypothetical protein